MCLVSRHTAPAPAWTLVTKKRNTGPEAWEPLCPGRGPRGGWPGGVGRWAVAVRSLPEAPREGQAIYGGATRSKQRFPPPHGGIWGANDGGGSLNKSIGIFDSGVGGLSVAREIRRSLSGEDLLYVADTAYCPYGDRPLEEVRTRALAVGRYLERAGAKLVVAACNTASGAALEQLRQALAMPVVGLEPAVKTGAAVTRNRKLGVMA